MKTYRLRCGCLCEKANERFVEMCAPCQAESDAVRTRWHADHKARAADQAEFFAMPAGHSTVEVTKI